MENKELEQLLERVTDILDRYGLMVCIVRKPRVCNRGSDYLSQMYGDTNVKQRREAMGLSAYQLAKRMGVDRNIVSRIEQRNRLHSKASMQRFADFFECSIEDLLLVNGGNDERTE